jgi:riboflavin synthase
MFTGIVTATFPIHSLTRSEAAASFVLEFDEAHLEALQIGASVALDGVCMTVTRVEGTQVFFDASIETLRRTTLGVRREGDRLNVERSAKAGAEVGGHGISGHVDGRGEVVAIERSTDNCVMTFKLPPELTRYVFNKGFVAVNGCSLTVNELDKAAGTFRVYLIPETLRQTTFDHAEVGEIVNIEIDRHTQILVDTIHDAVRAALSEGIQLS